ncbi:MAG TPA: IS200/IS605 family transposase [Blastocatellia bacterium]|jgi:REP element-mobilizing transposase RayT
MAGNQISLLIHFIWSTVGREPWIDPEWKDRLFSYIGGVLQNKNAKLLCAGGMPDHIHLYVSLPSTTTLAEIVNAMKANSSRWVHDSFPERREFAWQKGYGAFSISKSIETRLIEYMKNQQEHHRRRSFKEEFLKLLDRHGVEYNEQYLWD